MDGQNPGTHSFHIEQVDPKAICTSIVVASELRYGCAHALGLTLVTDNTREFSRVRGLVIENWLDR
ncbi:type II toxin-antitoxin system VapC family toxin [Paraburkholderia sp. BCC1886]|uniref:type II toxin-antitoxin system VapC family toxin n=1 Tax=Paraburkholderia sp. BCC1886 TaxID=2562670 RepID=UPI001182C05B|nr:type II toxin-antitoxin system VapC family toxin [Paraburkholderia sp. BCC1886]